MTRKTPNSTHRSRPSSPRLSAEEAAGLSESIERAKVSQKAVRDSAEGLAEGISRRFAGHPMPGLARCAPSSEAESISDELDRLLIANRAPVTGRPWTVETTIILLENGDTARELESAVKRRRSALNHFLSHFLERGAEHLAFAELLAVQVQRAVFAHNAFLDACRETPASVAAPGAPATTATSRKGRSRA